MALETGSRLGPYEVVGQLDSGAMGEVYRARDPRLEREVAIKVLPEEIADRRHLLRFEQEARAAGALNHPNVLAVHDVGDPQRRPLRRLGAARRPDPAGPPPGGPLPAERPSTSRWRSPAALPPPTTRESSTATSSPTTFRHQRRPDQDPRLRPRQADAPDAARPRRRPGHRSQGPRNRAWCWGRWASCRPSRYGGRRWTTARTLFGAGALRDAHGRGVRSDATGAVETMNAILKDDPPEVSRTGRGISPGSRPRAPLLEKRAGDRFHSAHDLALALEAASSGLSDRWPERGSVAAFAVSLKRHKRRLLVALAAMVLVAGGLYRGLVRSPAPTGVDVIDSVAVLPFENVGGDPDHEYLSDGIADTLINELSRLPNLRVIARSTSFRFRGSEVDPRQVGRDLGVGAVLTRTRLPAGRHPGHRSRAR